MIPTNPHLICSASIMVEGLPMRVGFDPKAERNYYLCESCHRRGRIDNYDCIQDLMIQHDAVCYYFLVDRPARNIVVLGKADEFDDTPMKGMHKTIAEQIKILAKAKFEMEKRHLQGYGIE